MSEAKQATPHSVLIEQLMDSRVPKTEREHAARREIEMLREALRGPAQQADKQEPVAWVCYGVGEKHDLDYQQEDVDALPIGTMLYAAAQREWVGLTEDEIDDIWNQYCDEMGEASINDAEDIARAIEAKLKEKNA